MENKNNAVVENKNNTVADSSSALKTTTTARRLALPSGRPSAPGRRLSICSRQSRAGRDRHSGSRGPRRRVGGGASRRPLRRPERGLVRKGRSSQLFRFRMYLIFNFETSSVFLFR